MHQLVGHLVVVLQRMNQADRLEAMLQRGIQRQPQELGALPASMS
jgi:hypothetical protein